MSCRSRRVSPNRSSVRPGSWTPEVVIKPTKRQIDDLIAEMDTVTARGERTLVTTLTKKMAEDLSDYLLESGLRVRYLHSNVDTIERIEIIRDLRLGEFDVLIGINLLREGLDLPEVSLVAILDADKEGFLRSSTSLIQTMGRAARNAAGRVVLYADVLTDSMRRAIAETERRRAVQIAYNKVHGIDPETIRKGRHRPRGSVPLDSGMGELLAPTGAPLPTGSSQRWRAIDAAGKRAIERLAGEIPSRSRRASLRRAHPSRRGARGRDAPRRGRAAF